MEDHERAWTPGNVCADKQAPDLTRSTVTLMPDDPRPDLDEKFSLFPMDPEEGLRRLLGSERDEDEDDGPEDEDL